MIEPMGWRHGLWRFPGHFLIWAAVPHLFSYALYAAGVHNSYLTPLAPIALALFVIIIALREWAETIEGIQTGVKGAIDFVAKVGGFTLGLCTWQWWWF